MLPEDDMQYALETWSNKSALKLDDFKLILNTLYTGAFVGV